MKWRLLNTGFHNGAYNMQFDIQLVESINSDEAYLRFYRWKPYCISLGKHQNINDINSALARKDGIDIVKRPTGGRAILHSEELTYSIVLPNSAELSNEEIYNLTSAALAKGLSFFDPVFSKVEKENLQPDFKSLYGKQESVLCFSSTARYEIKYEGKKLIGSAQRRMANGLLQHGSILVGTHHRNIVKYLSVPDEDKLKILKEITEKTTEISTILNSEIDFDNLTEALIRGFTEVWKIDSVTNHA